MTAVSFEFATAGRIMAGAGRAAELPGVLAGLGSRVLVCTGANPGRHAGLLAGLGPPSAVFAVPGEPTADLARAGVAAAREHGADVIAAIGGGSVIDTAKAVAAAGHRGQWPGRADPVPGAVRLGPGHPADRRTGPRGAAPRGPGPARRLRRRR
jgi:alcohol dehydrogenase class IV